MTYVVYLDCDRAVYITEEAAAKVKEAMGWGNPIVNITDVYGARWALAVAHVSAIHITGGDARCP